MRRSGVQLNLSCLPSRCGYGALGDEAEGFVKFLVKSRQSFWQLNALGDEEALTPLSSYSSFAGNALYIDENQLIEQGLLRATDREQTPYANYTSACKAKRALLEKAYYNFFTQPNLSPFYAFCDANKSWLESYALYCTAREVNNGKSWQYWSKPLADATPSALKEFYATHEERIEFYRFEQYVFHTQWGDFKQKANDAGIQLIGVLPFYRNADSADAWSNKQFFSLDKQAAPLENLYCNSECVPLYNWKHLSLNRYAWWGERIKAALGFYDIVVLQSAALFESCAYTRGNRARRTKVMRHKGNEILTAMLNGINASRIIADDTHCSANTVKLLNNFFGGVTVAQLDVKHNNAALANVSSNSTAYLSYGDVSAFSWVAASSAADKKRLKSSAGAQDATTNAQLCQLLLGKLANCAADTVILSMKDLTGETSAAPYTAYAKYLSANDAEKLATLTLCANRAE